MGIEIRPCRNDAEMSQYWAILGNAFAVPREEAESFASIAPREWTLCAFDEARLVASSARVPVFMRLNGTRVSACGVTSVATLPSHRRRGLLRMMMQELLNKAHEDGQVFALLTASLGAIYQRFGYGLASTMVQYRFDPREAMFAFDAPAPGHTEFSIAKEALPILKEIHAAYVETGNLGVERPYSFWELGALKANAPKDDIFAGIYRDAQGSPRGYVTYGLRNVSEGEIDEHQAMNVTEFVALDIDSYRGLWEFIRSHDLVSDVNIPGLVIAEDDPAPLLLLEPRALHRLTSDGVWMRVVDAETALRSRRYSRDVQLRIAVMDDAMCPWNNGAYRLHADAGGECSIERVGEDAEADVTVNPNALASLISGHISATRLANAGLLRFANRRALWLANQAFATERAPHCLEGF